MKRTLLFSFLLLTAAWVLAQTSDMSKSDTNGSETTIQGCLSGSTSNGFVLTDASGVQYQLQGNSTQLNANLNKEVMVKGTAAASPDPSAGSGNSGANAPQVFNVTRLKKVADSCPASK